MPMGTGLNMKVSLKSNLYINQYTLNVYILFFKEGQYHTRWVFNHDRLQYIGSYFWTPSDPQAKNAIEGLTSYEYFLSQQTSTNSSPKTI